MSNLIPADIQKELASIATETNVELLTDWLNDTAASLLDNIAVMAAIVKRLDELGVQIRFDNALLPYVRMVANGRLLGACLVALSGEPMLLDQAVKAPLELQERMASGDWFDVLMSDGAVRKVSVLEMTKGEIMQVFSRGQLRTMDEQSAYLGAVAARPSEKRARAERQQLAVIPAQPKSPATEPQLGCLDHNWLTEVTPEFNITGAGMPAEEAAAVANRVMLHLYRGSIEQARDALDDGWRSHLKEQVPLPVGKELLSEPLARVIDDVRLLNMLEEAEIETIGDLLVTGEATLLGIPNLGNVLLSKLRNLSIGLRMRVQAERDDEDAEIEEAVA